MGAYEKLQQHNTEIVKTTFNVHNSLQYMNMPVQLLGNVLPQGTTKFSVKEWNHTLLSISLYTRTKCLQNA